jgi:anti-sigma B factor antagonist
MPYPPSPTSAATPVSDMGALQIRTVFVDGNRAWVQLTGELDLASSDELTALFGRYLYAGCSTLVLDLAGLTFLDCAGLSVLVRAHNGCLARGGRLVMRQVGPRVAWLLGVTHLDSALTIEDRSDAHESTGAAAVVTLRGSAVTGGSRPMFAE